VYRLVRTVDISPVLAVLDQLKFTHVNIGSKDPGKSPCQVVLGSLPDAIHRFVSSLALGGETKRIMVRKLGPYQGMAPHVDQWMPKEADWHRYQVPLVTHPDIVMRWPDDGIEVHLMPGRLYEIRFDRLHEVVNPTPYERIHLQIDQSI
jgi:hypothetical protein